MSITPSVAVEIVELSSVPISIGNTLYVGGSGPNNYTRIQDAIDNASEGDTVFVYNGIYDDFFPDNYACVKIDKSINLVGEDKDTTIIDSNYGGYGFIVSADWVNLSGFTIRNGASGISMRTDYNTIKGNIILNCIYGISLTGYNNNITYNTISNNEYGIVLGDFAPNASFNVSGVNTILKNNFLDNKQRNAVFYSIRFSLNRWNHNYWCRPRLLPKLIFGTIGIIPWINIDWRPAILPNKI